MAQNEKTGRTAKPSTLSGTAIEENESNEQPFTEKRRRRIEALYGRPHLDKAILRWRRKFGKQEVYKCRQVQVSEKDSDPYSDEPYLEGSHIEFTRIGTEPLRNSQQDSEP